jgi:6-phosphogluconolactonase (cycloisomerase 2 family)
MKFSKLSQLFLVSSIGLLVATFLTACQLVTVDYIFVANGTGIDTYAVDSQSGALRTGAPLVSSGVNAPVAMAVSADDFHLYVANQGNNTVVHYTIASNGVLTAKDTVTLATKPVSLAVNTADTFLYVVSGTTSATLTAFPLSSGTIGTALSPITLSVPGFGADTVVPTGVAVLANNAAVFVTAYDQSAYNPGVPNCGLAACSTASPGWVFGYSVGSGGALTPASGSPFKAGIKPSAIVAEPANRFVYVTDFASNQLIAYGINNGSTLSYLPNGPFKTGNEPIAIAVDPRGKFLYVANQLDSSVTAFSIDLTTGSPSQSIGAVGSSINSTDTEPVAIAVDPSLGRFVYTANKLGNSVSGFRLDPTSGALTTTQSSPYPTGQAPTAVVIVPHGNHSLQTVSY